MFRCVDPASRRRGRAAGSGCGAGRLRAGEDDVLHLLHVDVAAGGGRGRPRARRPDPRAGPRGGRGRPHREVDAVLHGALVVLLDDDDLADLLGRLLGGGADVVAPYTDGLSAMRKAVSLPPGSSAKTSRPARSPRVSMADQGVLIDQLPAGRVDDEGAGREGLQQRPPDEVSGLGLQGEVDAQDVRALASVEGRRGVLDAQLGGLGGREGSRPRPDVDAEGVRPRDDLSADAPDPQQGEGLAEEAVRLPELLRPGVGPQGDDVVCDGDRG